MSTRGKNRAKLGSAKIAELEEARRQPVCSGAGIRGHTVGRDLAPRIAAKHDPRASVVGPHSGVSVKPIRSAHLRCSGDIGSRTPTSLPYGTLGPLQRDSITRALSAPCFSSGVAERGGASWSARVSAKLAPAGVPGDCHSSTATSVWSAKERNRIIGLPADPAATGTANGFVHPSHAGAQRHPRRARPPPPARRSHAGGEVRQVTPLNIMRSTRSRFAREGPFRRKATTS
jgi:hypothetical protein